MLYYTSTHYMVGFRICQCDSKNKCIYIYKHGVGFYIFFILIYSEFFYIITIIIIYCINVCAIFDLATYDIDDLCDLCLYNNTAGAVSLHFWEHFFFRKLYTWTCTMFEIFICVGTSGIFAQDSCV